MYAKSQLLEGAAFFVAIIICFGAAKKHLQNNDFGKTFGDKCTKAKAFLQKQASSFTAIARPFDADVKFMQAIVFPEVMRYNEVYDGIQIESLKVLYTEWGTDYADFSIGHFQMKPSFALQVEEKMKTIFLGNEIEQLGFAELLHADETEQRTLRVEYLEDTEWQIKYLLAFVKICDQRFTNKNWNDENEKLRWYATIYNRGFQLTDEEIEKHSTKSQFYLSKGMPEKKYCYAAIAQSFFEN
jgi:uncharacterized protein YnzC (UPF0291/DUF896 family)